MVGDDLLATDADRVRRAADEGIVDAVLVKPPVAGTLSRTGDVVRTARQRGLTPVPAGTTGDTCDAFVADLAVGIGAGAVKFGGLVRGERIEKCNRLSRIEVTTDLPFAGHGR